MDDRFKIYIDRLKNGHSETIEESYSPEFMEVEEEELHFRDPIALSLEASLADESLVLLFSLETMATMPCSICNEDVKVKIKIEDFSYCEDLERIKGHVYDFQNLLRETILLEVPLTAECNGNCPERATVAKYISKEI